MVKSCEKSTRQKIPFLLHLHLFQEPPTYNFAEHRKGWTADPIRDKSDIKVRIVHKCGLTRARLLTSISIPQLCKMVVLTRVVVVLGVCFGVAALALPTGEVGIVEAS